MGKRYSQLDLDERIELGCLRDAGYSLRKIGKFMNRSHATVSRELRRNSLSKAGYKPARADIIAGVRRDRPCKLQRLSTLREHVHDRLVPLGGALLACRAVNGMVTGTNRRAAQATTIKAHNQPRDHISLCLPQAGS